MICDICKENSECTFKYMVRSLGNSANCNHFKAPDNWLQEHRQEFSNNFDFEKACSLLSKEILNQVRRKAVCRTSEDCEFGELSVTYSELTDIIEDLGVELFKRS